MHRDLARTLRKNLTDAERFAWSRLRGRQLANYRFRRQVPLGDYVVDFVCLSHRLVVELDGGQHGEPEQQEADDRRTEWLEAQGFQVLRFWNHEVLTDWDTVEHHIWQTLENVTPHPNPPPQGGRGQDSGERG